MNRRDVLAAIPAVAAFPLTLLPSRNLCAQDVTGSQAQMNKLSPSVVKGCLEALYNLGLAFRAKNLTLADVASLQTAFDIYNDNEAETGYFDFVNKQVMSGTWDLSLSEGQIDQALKSYTNLGLPGSTASMKAQLLNLSESDQSNLIATIRHDGFERMTRDATNQVGARLKQMVNDGSTPHSSRVSTKYFRRVHTLYCDALAVGTVVAILTANAPAAAYAFVAMYASGC